MFWFLSLRLPLWRKRELLGGGEQAFSSWLNTTRGNNNERFARIISTLFYQGTHEVALFQHFKKGGTIKPLPLFAPRCSNVVVKTTKLLSTWEDYFSRQAVFLIVINHAAHTHTLFLTTKPINIFLACFTCVHTNVFFFLELCYSLLFFIILNHFNPSKLH